MVYPTIYRVSTIQGGAGFLPSTVVILWWWSLAAKLGTVLPAPITTGLLQTQNLVNWRRPNGPCQTFLANKPKVGEKDRKETNIDKMVCIFRQKWWPKNLEGQWPSTIFYSLSAQLCILWFAFSFANSFWGLSYYHFIWGCPWFGGSPIWGTPLIWLTLW